MQSGSNCYPIVNLCIPIPVHRLYLPIYPIYSQLFIMVYLPIASLCKGYLIVPLAQVSLRWRDRWTFCWVVPIWTSPNREVFVRSADSSCNIVASWPKLLWNDCAEKANQGRNEGGPGTKTWKLIQSSSKHVSSLHIWVARVLKQNQQPRSRRKAGFNA